jgi:membrane protein DedA with SNARE-associated domain/membrane-associated phospholipid phosphatase
VILAAAIKWTWLVGGIGLAGFLLARRRNHGRLTLGAGLVVAALAVAIGVRVIPLPNFEELILRVGETLGPWTYLLVGVMAYLETGAFVGLVAPGETTVIVGGLVAGQGQISLVLLIALVWTCAVAGDLTSYALGRRLGREFLIRHGPRLKITEARLAHVEAFFARRGGMTILIGRFIGLVRALAPFVAGASRMPLRTFLPYDVLGAGAWATTFCVLGYVFWRSFHQLTTYVSRGLLAFGSLVALGVAIWWLVQLRRDPERRRRVRAWLAEREDRRGWRPLVRAAGPLWRGVGRPAAAGAEGAARFSWARFTPGALGLELTTMLALAAVGGFAFYAIGDSFDIGAWRTADDAAASVAKRLRGDMLVQVAKVVTALGTWPAVAIAAGLTAVWAATRRRWIDAAALVAGVALEPLVMHAAKAAYDRPRPAGGLVDTMLSAYPSGHATYAITWVACALVLVRAGTGWAVRFAAVTVAIGLVAAIALTRIYLGVHWLSDVVGGVALGIAVWSLVGCFALIAAFVRHNGARSP